MNFESTDLSPTPPSLILLCGDNTRTTLRLGQALVEEGFGVELASGYPELEAQWRQRRHPVVLLEVSGPQAVEDAVNAALSLKRRDPRQFVGYLADPGFQTSGLAGDGIFPRASRPLAMALKRFFASQALGN
ncbi:MAG: hypothetical protein WBD10_05755 [Acidobacteriaceae bacterium]